MLSLRLAHSSETDVFKRALSIDKPKIVAYFTHMYEIDPLTYEGGIDTWFGPGSVMLLELECIPTIIYKQNHIELILD